jgi:hypothetical protein
LLLAWLPRLPFAPLQLPACLPPCLPTGPGPAPNICANSSAAPAHEDIFSQSIFFELKYDQ